MTMLNAYNLERRKTAVLQNAFDVVEEHEINQIYSLNFTIPVSDEKTKYIQPRHFVRWGDNSELYRIKKPTKSESNTDVITYECEHVITTLCDTVLFGSHNVGGAGMRTADVIRWLLDQQHVKNWVLAECDFDRKFEYLWEQENILNALYSIPKEFTSPYIWIFDTTVYPWRISLKAIDPNGIPQYYLRAKSNILSAGSAADYSNICTRIYPLGYGEGVNQLNIKDVNGGVPYLQSPANIVAQYGIVEKVLVDRRFENAESLKAYAQAMLEAYQEPSMSRSFDVTDLYPITKQSWDDAEVGKMCRMTQDNSTAYITKTRRQLDKAGDLQIEISTKANDIASNIADLHDRVRIESVYAQGATQLYQHSKDANATTTKGMVMSLYFPEEMRQINKVLLRLKLGKFRSYSQTTESNGGYKQTLSVEESSKTIETQTNTQDASVTVKQSSVTIDTQTNTQNESVTVQTQSNIVTVGMDADADQNLTTTRGGGGSGTTSYNIGDNTIDINTTTGVKWGGDPEVILSDMRYNVGTGDSIRNYDEDGNHLSSTPTNTSASSHQHYTYVPYHHYHEIAEFFTGISVSKLAHSHTINASGVGNHSHSFTVGDHTHDINIGHTHKVTVPSQTLSIPCPKHKHSITIPAQTLSVPCPRHKHSITIPGWSKTIEIAPHAHGIQAGIFESGNPTSFGIYVGGKLKTTINSTSYNDDISTWLLNSDNKIPRNTWIDVEFRPNDLAYVQCSVFVQGFVQSRGGSNY